MDSGVFVGREREIAQLLGGLEDARSGRGGLFLLAGEPGIGKSRLTDELASRARAQGARVLWGRCWEAGGAPGYWPWVQLLRSCLRGQDPATVRVQLGDGAVDLAQMLPVGGRDRKAASAAERARANVTRAIRSALARTAEHSPALGRHLETTLHTGTFCSYVPDARVPMGWQL